jgi:hypothetical protein
MATMSNCFITEILWGNGTLVSYVLTVSDEGSGEPKTSLRREKGGSDKNKQKQQQA